MQLSGYFKNDSELTSTQYPMICVRELVITRLWNLIIPIFRVVLIKNLYEAGPSYLSISSQWPISCMRKSNTTCDMDNAEESHTEKFMKKMARWFMKCIY